MARGRVWPRRGFGGLCGGGMRDSMESEGGPVARTENQINRQPRGGSPKKTCCERKGKEEEDAAVSCLQTAERMLLLSLSF